MAAGNMKFDEALAAQWEQKSNSLKEQADAVLKKIAQCLQDMQGASDNITAAIYEIGSKIAPEFQKLVDLVVKVIDLFNDIRNKLKEMAQNAIDGLKTAAHNMLGGLTINATTE